VKRFSVRLRFTALYSGLFLATAATLLVGMNLVLNENLHRQVAGIPGVAFQSANLTPAQGPRGFGPPPAATRPRHPGSAEDSEAPAGSPPDMHAALESLPHAVLTWQWIIAGIMIVVLTLISIVGGWWLAGRLLRPVRHITETARRLSLSNLHERIALTGQRDEFFELAQTFDSMLERLERSVDNQRRFIANAAHELRTPLAIQRAAIQIGLDCPSPERLAQVREELLEVNRRNEGLINGLLLLAHADHGLEATEPVALDALVREAVSETPTTDGIVIRQNTQPALVDGDPVLLHRLAANLIHNAVRYNQPDGLVDIRVTAAGALTIRNSGPEIPEHLIDQLFEPFRSLHKARTGSSASAGLGLSIVASIARAHNAAISARPNPGGGLELTVQFHVIQQQ
jgi:signal transduction histidine kinase